MSVTPIPAPGPWDQCPWPVDPACMTEEWNAVPEEIRTRAIRLMTTTMRALTAYVVGGCPVTIRPCSQPCGCVGVVYTPQLTATGEWVNVCPACTVSGEVALPEPCGGVLRVLVDGQVVPESDWTLHNGHILVYTGAGETPWPAVQDLRKPDSEVGTFSVTYLNSYPVDANGQWAGGVLAMEFAKACTGSKGCRLPSTVRSVSRQGLSFEIPAGAFPDGLTGIREVDAYIMSVRPNPKMSYAASLYSPSRKPPRVVPTSVPLP